MIWDDMDGLRNARALLQSRDVSVSRLEPGRYTSDEAPAVHKILQEDRVVLSELISNGEP